MPSSLPICCEQPTNFRLKPKASFMRFPFWISFLLLPLVVGVLVLISLIHVFGSAIRWIVIWSCGFFGGGAMALILNAIIGTEIANKTLWAAGGFLGLILLSSMYGMCLEWLFWMSRHEDNPYIGIVSLSPEQESKRVAFAKSLHWPTALASALGGVGFAYALFPIIAGMDPAWPTLSAWCWLGALGLAAQGGLLGLYLGWKRNRVVFNNGKNSFGEFIGWQIAGTDRGWRPALGWGLGYALHQFPRGAVAGFFLGGLTRILLY